MAARKQGKVRRMRPSPFHKGSGDGAAAAAAKPVARKAKQQAETSEDEVRHVYAFTQQRWGRGTTAVLCVEHVLVSPHTHGYSVFMVLKGPPPAVTSTPPAARAF